MNESKNKVQLVGFLGGDPELKETTTGRKVARFTVATNETYLNNQGETVTETQWHHLVAWGKLAEKAEQELNKGMQVSVEGKLVHRSYVDKEGIKRFTTEVNVQELAVLSHRTKTEA